MIIPVPDPRRDFDHPLLGHTKSLDAYPTSFDPAREGFHGPAPVSFPSALLETRQADDSSAV